MILNDAAQLFLDGFEDWVSEGYSLDCRYLALEVNDELRVIHAIAGLSPTSSHPPVTSKNG